MSFFFMWRMTKHEKKPWRMWRMWYTFQIFMSPYQSGGSSSDTEVMWAFLGKTLWLLIPKSHENMILSEHCSISHTFISVAYSHIFDTKAALKVTISSFQCVSCISLKAVSDSNKLCVITNLLRVHCVTCQFGIKQGQTLFLISGDSLVVILILKKCTRAADLWWRDLRSL